MSAEQLHYELETLQDEVKQLLLQFRRQKTSESLQNNIEQLLKRMKTKFKQLQAACKAQPDNKTWQQWREDHKKEYTSLRATFDKIAPAPQPQSNESSLSDSFNEKKKKPAAPQQASNNVSPAVNDRPVIVSKQPISVQHDNDMEDEVRVVKKTKLAVADEELNSKLEQELFAPVFQTYDKTLQLLDKMNRDAEETIQIAQDTAVLLAQQEEKMKKIDGQLDELAATTTRAKRELVSLARKLAADKCILILCILCVLAIAAFALFTIGAFILRPVIENAIKNNKKQQ